MHLTDTALTGSIYGENIGWIILNPQTYGGVTNNTEGVLSGYAWSENAGWIDFSHVSIGSDGVFTGSAYSENIGWITFGTGDNKVLTDYRPYSTRNPPPNREMGGVYSMPWTVNPWTAVVPTLSPTITPTISTSTSVISTTTVDSKIIPIIPPTVTVSKDTLNISETETKTIIPAETQFSRNLTVMSTGKDVKELQQFLNNNGFLISTKGYGSPNNETTYFGNATKKALIQFQIANNISPAKGYFGQATRDFIKNIDENRKLKPKVAEPVQIETKQDILKTEVVAVSTSTVPVITPEPSTVPITVTKPTPSKSRITTSSTESSSSIFTRDLSFNMSGKDVLFLQEFLIKQNTGSKSEELMKNGVTGYFGILTKFALIEFQTANGIAPPNGYFGLVTKTAIENIIQNPVIKIVPEQKIPVQSKSLESKP